MSQNRFILIFGSSKSVSIVENAFVLFSEEFNELFFSKSEIDEVFPSKKIIAGFRRKK